MGFKKLITENNYTDMKKFVYKGENVQFCLRDDYDFEIGFCKGRLRIGEAIIKKDELFIEHYDPILDEDITYEPKDIVVLKIEVNKAIRNYFDNIGKDKGDDTDEQVANN